MEDTSNTRTLASPTTQLLVRIGHRGTKHSPQVRDEKRTEDMMGARFKQCPYCGYGPIERELGCTSMTCGKHAQDKVFRTRL